MACFDLLGGDSRALLPTLPQDHFDAIITDPPYELGFMGKSWDKTGIAYDPSFWAQALRVLKPGGHLLAFGGSRTFHRIAVAIEDAGFELRDTLCWLYGSGFPKSLNITRFLGSAYQGWGTALKPAFEPIIMARKPIKGTVAQNVSAWRTGGINIEACRIGTNPRYNPPTTKGLTPAMGSFANSHGQGSTVQGRWPANVLLDEVAAELLDQSVRPTKSRPNTVSNKGSIWGSLNKDCRTVNYSDEGGPSRFYYTAKASKKERSAGLTEPNTHSTVKPLSLMRWLCRLVTPTGGTIVDPFTGSGSTGVAALEEQFNFLGIEQSPEYLSIAEARLLHASCDLGTTVTEQRP